MRRMVVGVMLTEFIYTLTVFLDDHNSHISSVLSDSQLNPVYILHSLRDRDELFCIAKLQGHRFIT